jgi:hypothetical protein
MVQEELKCILLCTVSSMSTNEASRQGVRTLLKFSSFDDNLKENTKAYKSRKESGSKTNDLNADTILNGYLN